MLLNPILIQHKTNTLEYHGLSEGFLWFTDLDESSPAYKSTFIVPASATFQEILAKQEAQKANFTEDAYKF